MDVVDHDEHRAAASRSLEELPGRPEDLIGGGRPDARAGDLGQPLGDQLGILLAIDQLGELVHDLLGVVTVDDARRAAQDLGERPERDAFAVRETPAVEHGGPGLERRDHLGRQPRLSRAGGPENREQVAGPVAPGVLEGFDREPQLVLSPDERRIEATGPRRRVLGHFDESVRDQWPFLSLDGQRRELLGRGRMPDEPVGVLAEEHLSRGGALLEPGGHVDRVADGERIRVGGVAGQDVPRVDAGSASGGSYRTLRRARG